MGQDTDASRGYAWGLQTDYVTQKTIAAAALTKIIASDNNTIDYTPKTNNDEGWAHGQNQATEQWIEAHDARVDHSMPAFIDQLGRVFILNLGNYAVATPGGGTTSKQHTFKPQDPFTSRQNKAVTYAETTGPGWNVLMPRAVSDGFSLKGDGLGIMTCDFGLQGAGLINPAALSFGTAARRRSRRRRIARNSLIPRSASSRPTPRTVRSHTAAVIDRSRSITNRRCCSTRVTNRAAATF
jgi:hypothetical protein